MKISDLSLDELKELVKGLVDDRLGELIGDPDPGLPLGEVIHARIKELLASTERISGDDVRNNSGCGGRGNG